MYKKMLFINIIYFSVNTRTDSIHFLISKTNFHSLLKVEKLLITFAIWNSQRQKTNLFKLGER
jgi:hypothetical protein